ncbi:MAG TPA: 50S ribosomal protein L10 [Chitinophagaceae bacterium]|nr:50S ribosomal protein L10 [Chitinophagaceae bacterium]
MTTDQKNKAIEALKEKFSQYNNFYITNTESLTVTQTNKLRSLCFDKSVEMKVAKNTLIVKALQQLDAEKYSGIMDAFHGVTALMFSESPKEPALLITSIRKEFNTDKPILKAALIGEEIYMGNESLVALRNIKTKNELIGEVIGLLKSPLSRVLSALQNKSESGSEAPQATAPESTPDAAPAADAPETPAADAPETPAAE